MPNLTESVRQQAWHYLNYEVAVCVGMSLAELQQFCAGAYTPSAQQIDRLAKRMGLER